MKPVGLCYERMKAKQRARYYARKQAGLCVYCPVSRPARRPLPGKVRCGPCLEYARAADRKRTRRRQKAGLCPRCGKQPPQPGFWGCIDCRLAQSEKQTRWRCRHDRAAVVN